MKKRRLSILLSIVMLLSLLPTTAFAASYAEISVNDIDLQDGEYLADNSSTSAQTATAAPSTYVAWYKDGTLTLKDYDGKGIETKGVAAGELTVKLIGTNSINNGSLVSDNGGNIIVTSDSRGTLSITNKISDSDNAAIGIETGLSSSYDTGNVAITGNAQVTIDMTHTGTSGSVVAYGIFAKQNITISGDASVGITCKTPSNTASFGSYCNGLYAAKKDVTIETDGKININVTTAGDSGTQSFGIYPMGTAKLTKVGEMEVQWKKHETNTNYPGGAVYNKGASLSDTDYAINVDETNCYASYRKGTPHTVTVENGTLTGPGVKYPNGSGMFLVNDTVNITPSVMKGKSGDEIPFQKWTSEEVTFTDPTAENNSFAVPANAVTVTAKHSPFVGTPTFMPIGTTGNEGTLTFKTKVNTYDGSEGFALVKEADVDTTSKYISINPSKTSTGSPYEYSSTVNFNNFPAGNYYVAEKLNGAWYLSDLFAVNYTAAPTGNYPDHVRMFNESGDTTSLSDKQYLEANSDTTVKDNFDGTQTYVARYEKSTGTLYLKDYHGVATDGRILADGDLNIKVEGDNSFTTSLSSATYHLYGIQANGTLTISGSGKLTVTANGNGNVYGIYAKEGVTISAPLDVRVGKVDSSKNGPLHGIYTESGAISLSGGDKAITATGGSENVYGVYNEAQTSSSAADNGNIDISGKLTVNLSNGENNRGISSQGGVITLNAAEVNIPSNPSNPGDFYYGIYNYKGNVIIENGSNVTLDSTTSGSDGIYTSTDGNLSIKNSTVKVSANGLAANLQGNVSIKDSTIELTKTANHHEVIRTGNSSTANTIDLSGSGSVTLTALGNQSGSSMIGGKVTATSGTKLEKGTYYPDSKTYDGEYNATSDKTVLQFVHESTAPTATVDAVTIDGTTGTAIIAAEVTITLTNDTFAPTLSGSWITNLPNGLSQSVSRTDDTHAEITVSGNPSAVSSDALAITIPAANLASNADLTVTNNPSAKYNITAPLTPIAVPTANTGLVYDGTEKTGVNDDAGYTLGGTYKATDVGATDYTATATLDSGYKWTDDTTDAKTINWNIGKRTPNAADFTFTAPADLTYDGNNKTASVTLKSPFTNSGEITVKYEKGGSVVTKTKDVGDYTVKIDVAGGDNFNADSNLNDPTWTFSITPANQNAPTGLGVKAPTAIGGKGKITGTTTAMEYSTDSGFASQADCSATATEVAPGTYYVRYKADANHNAGAVSAALVVPDYSATKYTVTVTNAGNGTASADMTSAVAGETVTLTATPNSGYVFDQWTDKTPAILTIGADGKFTMPGENVSVKATFKPAALTGTASITGNLKYGEELTASLTGTNNTGDLNYKWYQNGTTQVAANNTGKYTLTADDIGKTITVKISSDVQTGEITSSATGTIEKADAPAAPAAFTLSFTPNSDGTTFTATIPTVVGGEYSFDGTNYSAANTKADCAANISYTGYVRIAATSTHKASTATSDTQTAPKLTVATPTFTPSGASSFSGTQSVTITCTTAGAKIYYTTDGTTPTASSTPYTTALTLTSTTTVKAIAVKTDMNNSAVATAVFTKASGTSGGSSGGGYVPTTQKPDIKAGEGGSIALSKDGTTATITPNAGMMIDKVMLNGKDMGAVTVVKGIKTGDKLEVSFKQTAEEKAKMDKAVAEQVAKTGLTARSARTAKKNVKLVVKGDLKAITDAGYTVKYKFYRSTKKSAGYKAMKTGKSGIYINTYGKKGTLYYYKVKVMVYDKDGNFVAQTALKQCKYASRLWTK